MLQLELVWKVCLLSILLFDGPSRAGKRTFVHLDEAHPLSLHAATMSSFKYMANS